MNKLAQAQKLIESDIISSKLVNTLDRIGIDSRLYLTDLSEVVFNLIEVAEKNRTDKVYNKYFSLVNKGIKIDFIHSKDSVKELSDKILKYLIDLK